MFWLLVIIAVLLLVIACGVNPEGVKSLSEGIGALLIFGIAGAILIALGIGGFILFKSFTSSNSTPKISNASLQGSARLHWNLETGKYEKMDIFDRVELTDAELLKFRRESNKWLVADSHGEKWLLTTEQLARAQTLDPQLKIIEGNSQARR